MCSRREKVGGTVRTLLGLCNLLLCDSYCARSNNIGSDREDDVADPEDIAKHKAELDDLKAAEKSLAAVGLAVSKDLQDIIDVLERRVGTIRTCCTMNVAVFLLFPVIGTIVFTMGDPPWFTLV